LFLEYACEIALARSLFQPKMQQISISGWAPPHPLGELTALSRPLAGLRGPKSKGRGLEEMGR